ncbi:hypothetical protein [Microbacterium sp. EST19A]|uniref:hypothetical protein n=1 Tax=Microbacterium sp. EST19A TaxID=2862681 RepID=UPI001CC08AB1|nr:hypothetical protein [Microbacterium sp. EST19A]
MLFLACVFAVSLAVLIASHYGDDAAWIVQHLPATVGSGAVLWQIQTTFLSVGFAGLAIAAQLFAETPLAVGASRGRVLDYMGAGQFVGVGLVANALIAIESIWLPSEFGIVIVALAWFAPTVALLVRSVVRLVRLFGRPSLLDEVVRASLVETILTRLTDASGKYASAKNDADALLEWDGSLGAADRSSITLSVPIHEGGRVIRALRPKAVRQAIESLALRATEYEPVEDEEVLEYAPPRVTLAADIGERTRFGQTAFRVITSRPLDDQTAARVTRLLQSSISFEPREAVTAYEESDREISSLKDATSTNLRAGAFATAERALDLLGNVIREVWMAELPAETSWQASRARRRWLFGSIGDVEQDALLSSRAAGMFVSAAMKRAVEAPRADSTSYVDECLRSFTRMWFEILRHGSDNFDVARARIILDIQNLAMFTFASDQDGGDLQARGVWAMVELVKLALDAKRPDAARAAGEELEGLFEFVREGAGRTHVRAGQLVLSAWLDYLAEKRDERDPSDPALHKLLTPRGSWSEIITARHVVDSEQVPFSRWDSWEMKSGNSGRAQVLELSNFIDHAQLAAMASSYGPLPDASSQDIAAEYERLIALLSDKKNLSVQERALLDQLSSAVAKWNENEDARLADEPLAVSRIEKLRLALRETLMDHSRLADTLPVDDDLPLLAVDTEEGGRADASRPILGMNFRVSRHYLVDKIFNQTYADPGELGRVIARGFIEGENAKILAELRTLDPLLKAPSSSAIAGTIMTLGDQAKYHVLVTPFGGLIDVQGWHSPEFREALTLVRHIETSMLDGEAILFDSRSTLRSLRKPEEKDGLAPVADTSISLGVFEDDDDSAEPRVRIETGEYFVVWAGDAPSVTLFGGESEVNQAE